MRRTILLLAAYMLAACDTPAEHLSYISTLPTHAKGIRLNHDGTKAYVGMSGMACGIDVQSGTVEQDIDPTEEDERVEDSTGTLDRGGVVLTSHSNGIHLLTESSMQEVLEEWAEPTLAMSHVYGARLLSDGFVALSGEERGCTLTRAYTDRPISTIEIAPLSCDSRSQLDIIDTHRWVIYGPSGVVVVDNNTAHYLDIQADVARASSDQNTLMVAYQDTATLVSLHGTTLKEIKIDGHFTALERFGQDGSFAVTMNTPQGARFGHLDDQLHWVTSQPIPEASSIAVSGDGRVVAFILPDAVHFYQTIKGL